MIKHCQDRDHGPCGTRLARRHHWQREERGVSVNHIPPPKSTHLPVFLYVLVICLYVFTSVGRPVGACACVISAGFCVMASKRKTYVWSNSCDKFAMYIRWHDRPFLGHLTYLLQLPHRSSGWLQCTRLSPSYKLMAVVRKWIRETYAEVWQHHRTEQLSTKHQTQPFYRNVTECVLMSIFQFLEEQPCASS